LLDELTIERVERNFAVADRLIFPLEFNGREMTARDIYFAYAEGEFFNDNPKARALLSAMSFMAPAADTVRFLFFNVCATYANLTLLLIDVVLEVEGRLPVQAAVAITKHHCVYCLTTSGDFGPEEHVFPEALGVDGMVLHGVVCQACNNALSRYDQFLAEDFELLALLRVVHVPLTKKGKFPHANFRDFKLEKIKPRVLRITNKTKDDVFVTEDLPDGSFRGKLNFTSRGPANMLRLARALFKIGLGMVAHDELDSVYSSHFDAARAFIKGDGNMPNHLVAVKTGVPVAAVGGAWQSYDGATGVELDLYGVRFVFNLEASPFGVPLGPLSDQVQAFWLGVETKGGVVLPCGADCIHGAHVSVPFQQEGALLK
jgi:hypothetical protein